jgi:hypothetical protein
MEWFIFALMAVLCTTCGPLIFYYATKMGQWVRLYSLALDYITSLDKFDDFMDYKDAYKRGNKTK